MCVCVYICVCVCVCVSAIGVTFQVCSGLTVSKQVKDQCFVQGHRLAMCLLIGMNIIHIIFQLSHYHCNLGVQTSLCVCIYVVSSAKSCLFLQRRQKLDTVKWLNDTDDRHRNVHVQNTTQHNDVAV